MSKKSNKSYFVSGISTEIGKTIASAVLVSALKADYWKPVQSGDLHHTDSMKVAHLAAGKIAQIHPEGFSLNTPASPHYSAEIDGVSISLKDFKLPVTDNHLVVEGAGGLMVPLNDKHLIIDLIDELQLPTILVSQNYLGSINHTLLSIEILKRRNMPIKGIVFNGPSTPSTESYIKQYTNVPVLFHLPELKEVNPRSIQQFAGGLTLNL